MSKTAEQKAWEAYPTPLDNEPFISKGFIEEKNREGYIKGYDQAMQDMVKDSERLQYLSDEIGYAYACGCKRTMQDFLNKACEWLSKQPMSSPVFWTVEDFKNYMEK